jgi:hypothetical protein
VFLILFSLAWRVVDCQNEHVVLTEIAERVLLARAYLANGATADWSGAAVDSNVARAAQDVEQVAPRLDVRHRVVAGFQANKLATVSFGIGVVRKRFELETARAW